jgi:hypothetical protein
VDLTLENLDFMSDEEDDVFSSEQVYDPNGQLGILDALVTFPDRVITKIESFYGETIFGREVGDDRVDLSKSPPALFIALIAQEAVLRMKTSWEDTFITKEHWNFCEVTNALPCNPNGSFDFARKTGNLDNLEYTDTPPLRIILDSFKGDKSHSSTAVGKAAMLGNRISTPRTEHKLVLQLASFMQDGMLRTAYSPDPKYIPFVCGGSNCPPLFGDPDNLHLYVKSYRGGGYDRLYGTAVNEIRMSLDALEEKRHVSLVLCRRLKDKQEYLHGTYAEKVLIPDRSERLVSISETPPMPLFKATGGSNIFSAVENRLLRTRVAITEPDAVREILRSKRIHEGLFNVTSSVNQTALTSLKKSREERSKFENALSANSAFQNLLKRQAGPDDVTKLIEEGFLAVGTGLREFSFREALWLSKGGKTKNYSIMDLTSSEAMYARDEVTEDSTLKVGGITLHPYISGKSRDVVTERVIGLYQINETQHEWGKTLISRLKEERDAVGRPLSPLEALPVLLENREWVNDDKLLIAECLQITEGLLPSIRTTVFLISDDKRLGNQMAETCNVLVNRISPRDLLYWWKGEPITSKTKISVFDLYTMGMLDGKTQRVGMATVLLDYGSIASSAMKIIKADDKSLGDHKYERQLIKCGYEDTPERHRFCEYNLKRAGIHTRWAKVHVHKPVYRTSSHRYGGLIPTWSHSEVSDGSTNTGWQSRMD